MRPEDKAFEALFPSPEDPLTSSFDQYVNGDLFEDTPSDKEYPLNGDTLDLGEQIDPQLSPIGTHPKREQSSPQPWRRGLWCLNQGEVSSGRLHVEKQRSKTQNVKQTQDTTNSKSETAAGLHTDISRSYKTPGLPSPPSPTVHRSSRSPQKTKYPMLGSQTVRYRNPRHRQHLARTASASPSPMRPAHYQQSAFYEQWQDMKDFSMQVPADGSSFPLSPPPSGRPLHEFQSGPNAPHAQMLQNGQMISQGTIGAGPSRNSFATSAGLSPNFVPVPYSHTSASQSAENIVLSPPLAQHQGGPAWTQDLFSPPSEYPSYDFNPDIHTPSHNQQPWWESPPNSGTHPPPEYYQHGIAAPTPQRPGHPIVHSPGFQHGGLMINYGEQQPIQMSTVEPIHSNYSTSEISSTNPAFSPNGQSFPSLPPSHQQDMHLTSPHHLNLRKCCAHMMA